MVQLLDRLNFYRIRPYSMSTTPSLFSLLVVWPPLGHVTQMSQIADLALLDATLFCSDDEFELLDPLQHRTKIPVVVFFVDPASYIVVVKRYSSRCVDCKNHRFRQLKLDTGFVYTTCLQNVVLLRLLRNLQASSSLLHLLQRLRSPGLSGAH